MTTVRAQLVMAHSLQVQMEKAIRAALLNLDPRTSVVVLKRLWDETASRLQLPVESLHQLLGDEVAQTVINSKRKGRGNRYPGFVVQSMQQMGFLRYGSAKESGCELIAPAKIVATTSADSLFNAVSSSIACLSPEELHRLSLRVRALVLYMFPDGLAGNGVVMQKIAELIPNAVVLPGHCVCHLLQICWDAGAQKTLGNPLYQIVQLMGNSSFNAKVRKATESQADDADIVVGIAPAPEGVAFNKFVLDYSVRRPLRGMSFFTEPGGQRHDEESYKAMREQIEEDCSALTDGLTAPWDLLVCTHNCWGDLPGLRCCTSTAAARDRLRRSLGKLADWVLSGLKALAANKWRSISDCLVRLSLGILAHGSLGRGFERTLATKAELSRLRQFIAAAEARPDVDLAGGVTDPLAFQVLRGKRILGAHAFLQRADTPFIVLSYLVAASPIDKLFATFFECEAFVKTEGGRVGDRGPCGLVQSMVSPTGVLHRVHVMLAAPLFDRDTPFHHLQGIAQRCSVEVGQGIRVCRSMQMRLSSSFAYRFKGTFRRKPMEMLDMLNVDPEERLRRMTVFLSPPDTWCRKCEGLFVSQLRVRLQAPPELSLAEQTDATVQIFESIAEDPLMVSSHEVEVLHAGGRNSGQRSMTRRKKLPVSQVTGQQLTRWVTLHKGRMKRNLICPDSVRQTILKKKAPLPRNKCGHNLFLRERNTQRNADPLATRTRASYRDHLTRAHAEWRTMSPADQEQYHRRAELEPIVVRLDTAPVDEHGTNPQSPWAIGSATYPCAAPMVQEVVNDLVPGGRKWLRAVYERCRAATEPEAVANVVVRDTRQKLDINGLRRRRLRARTCWEAHPGLCCSDVNASSIINLHGHLARGLRRFNDLKPETSDGVALFLFTGFRRKRDAERAFLRPDHQDIGGDEFEMAFLSDQPDRRRRLMSFTRCLFVVDDERTFHCGSHARLVLTESLTLDDVESFRFVKLLRDRCRWWLAHQLVYDDVPGEYHVIKALCLFDSRFIFRRKD